MLFIVQSNCQPCNGVAASLPDARMQRALEGVRVVRLDASDFRVELRRLKVPLEKQPGFVLFGAGNVPVDYVHGGEWDEDIARNIAPVLGKFARGTYLDRRDPWQGLKRDDETPL